MQNNAEKAQVQDVPAKKTNPNREALKQLSKIAKMAVAQGMADSVNGYLLEVYEQQEGEGAEFNTLREWNKKGYTVKKGSKAFLIWGKKKEKEESAAKVQEDTSQQGEEQEEQANFWPVCYLFSSNQVTKRPPKTAKP